MRRSSAVNTVSWLILMGVSLDAIGSFVVRNAEVVAGSSEPKPSVEHGEYCEIATRSLTSMQSLYSACLCYSYPATFLNIRLSIADRLFQPAENRLIPKYTVRR